ncbi:hypothetical protein LTS10_006074 [Elasticomyces elasticus]|nr:hypothetical protein LTS10_006074 [Elasticomyces elasticus]
MGVTKTNRKESLRRSTRNTRSAQLESLKTKGEETRRMLASAQSSGPDEPVASPRPRRRRNGGHSVTDDGVPINNRHLQGQVRLDFGDFVSGRKSYIKSIPVDIMFTPDDAAQEEKVGYLLIYVVDKSVNDTVVVRKSGRQVSKIRNWISELLLPLVSGKLASLSMALRSLYKLDATPQAQFVEGFGQMLIPTTMVYIDKLEINSDLEGKGFGHVTMQSLRRLLPVICATDKDIGMLLQPDFIPEEDRDAKRKGKQEELMIFYPKHGYEVIYKEEDTLPCYFLMGRLLKGEEGSQRKDADSDAEEEDIHNLNEGGQRSYAFGQPSSFHMPSSREQESRRGFMVGRHDSTQPTLPPSLLSGKAEGIGDNDASVQDVETMDEEDIEIDDDDEEMEDGEDAVLSDFEEVDNDRAEGTVGVELRDVQPDGIYHESVRAIITFQTAGQPNTFDIGDIEFQIIDKTVGAEPPQVKHWITELVQEDANGELRDPSSALQTLYDVDGFPKDAFKQYKKALKTDTIVYINILQLNASAIALRELGDDVGDITVILQPEMLNEPGNTEEKRKGIQQSLIRMYKGCGYKIWHQQDARIPCYVLMGQVLEGEVNSGHEESENDESGDEMMETD